MKSINLTSGRIRRASLPLATEINPVTLEAMRLENVRLENRLLALEQLQSAELELRMAIHEWFMDDETELVVDFETGNGYCMPGPVTLSFLLEHSLYSLHFWAFERALYGELPRYICDDCKQPDCGSCGSSSVVCGEFSVEAARQGMTEQELVNHVREVRTPLRFKRAAKAVIDARARVERTYQ